jgi:hypothetical protein
MNLLPGGYTFTNIVFWTVVGMIVIGTNAVAMILSMGLGILILESIGRG